MLPYQNRRPALCPCRRLSVNVPAYASNTRERRYIQLNHRIHMNAAHHLRRRAQSHECTLLQGEGEHRRRSCRSLRAPCGLCLGEPSCTPSCPPPQERPYNIGNKSCSGSNTNSPPMPSAPKPVTHLQQPPFSFFPSPIPPNRMRHNTLADNFQLGGRGICQLEIHCWRNAANNKRGNYSGGRWLWVRRSDRRA